MLIVFIRVLIIYLLIIFSLRLMGKRQLGQLQPSELVVTILVSNIATMCIEDTNVPFLSGIIPILSLVSFDVIMSAISLKSKKARRIISGSPRVIIHDGKLDQAQMHELRFTLDDVMSQLRTKNIFDIRDVSFAIVETTGTMSVFQKADAQTITPKMLGMQMPEADNSPPTVLVSDGAVIDSGLKYCNLRPEWLTKTVSEHGLSLKDVFLMTCNRQADYLIVKKEDPAVIRKKIKLAEQASEGEL